MNTQAMELIKKYSVKNALDYGSANFSNVLKKVISEDPSLKSNMELLKAEVKSSTDKINLMSKEEILKMSKKYETEFEKAREIKLKETSSANIDIWDAKKGAFVTRFPPEPNGPMHIGHAKALFIEKELAEKYNGKIFLYFDDTNPSKEKQKFVDMFINDLNWLGISFDDIYYASDNIEKTYIYGKKMLEDGNAYICWCKPDLITKGRFERTECEHRASKPDRNIVLFEQMLKGEHNSEGYVVRFKGDMKSDNTTMRDPIIFRIITAPHYRQGNKYNVWPKYEFNTPIMDSIHGITHTIRSKEYELGEELYFKILELLNLRKPHLHIISRLIIKDNITSKREIMKLIDTGNILGYDDPRLITIAGLRRRGVIQSAIKSFVLKFGTGKSESKTDLSTLLDINRKLILPTAKRLFYVEQPILVDLEKTITSDIPIQSARDTNNKNYTVDKIYISKTDADSLKIGDIIRMKGLCSIRVKSKNDQITTIFLDTIPKEIRTIQWVPANDFLKCKIITPTNLLKDGQFYQDSLSFSEGLIEGYAKELVEEEIVQLERFGFVILDKKDDLEFIFISK